MVISGERVGERGKIRVGDKKGGLFCDYMKSCV